MVNSMLEKTKRTIHYNLENMDQTELCQTFNYHSYPFSLAFSPKYYRRFLGFVDHYTLGDVYRMFERGQDVQGILNNYPDVSMRAVLIGRTFYNLHNPQACISKLNRILKVLIDENIDILHTVDGGMQTLGYTSHLAFAGLMGAKDARLWGYCRARGINILVTKDRTVNLSRKTKDDMDITRCAILAWGRAMKKNGGIVDENMRMMPVILHVPHDATPTQIKNLIRKHQKTIFDVYDERVSPVIELTKGKVKPGIHFMEILDGDLKFQSTKLRDLRVDTLIANFDLTLLPYNEIKEMTATFKRAVEHEISTELQHIEGRNNRIIYINDAEKSFDADTYNYSGPMEKLHDAYLRVITGDPLLRPIEDRLEDMRAKKKAAESLQMA